MVNTHKPTVGILRPQSHQAEDLLHELEDLTRILQDAGVRLQVLEYHLAKLEASEIVAGFGQTAVSQTYTLDELSGMVGTYLDAPLQMMALWHMFKSGDPVQQQDAVRTRC